MSTLNLVVWAETLKIVTSWGERVASMGGKWGFLEFSGTKRPNGGRMSERHGKRWRPEHAREWGYQDF